MKNKANFYSVFFFLKKRNKMIDFNTFLFNCLWFVKIEFDVLLNHKNNL